MVTMEESQSSNAFCEYITKTYKLTFFFFFLKTKKGLFGGRWYFKLFNLILFLGGMVMACLGKHTDYPHLHSITDILWFRHVGCWRIYQDRIPDGWSCYFIWMSISRLTGLNHLQ
jgi:hypothetical protein